MQRLITCHIRTLPLYCNRTLLYQPLTKTTCITGVGLHVGCHRHGRVGRPDPLVMRDICRSCILWRKIYMSRVIYTYHGRKEAPEERGIFPSDKEGGRPDGRLRRDDPQHRQEPVGGGQRVLAGILAYGGHHRGWYRLRLPVPCPAKGRRLQAHGSRRDHPAAGGRNDPGRRAARQPRGWHAAIRAGGCGICVYGGALVCDVIVCIVAAV